MDLDTLHTLTELKYQKSMAGLADILERENQLRGEIQQLRDQAYEAQALQASPHSMQNIGADVIWLRWVSQTTQRLNIELAQVLARKETLLADHRRALGRKSVAGTLADDARRDAKAARDAAALKKVIDVDLMRRFGDQ
ncbi:MAG: hypothetical protein AAFZ99_08100 [Pseudomonadota bacterium]